MVVPQRSVLNLSTSQRNLVYEHFNIIVSTEPRPSATGDPDTWAFPPPGDGVDDLTSASRDCLWTLSPLWTAGATCWRTPRLLVSARVRRANLPQPAGRTQPQRQQTGSERIRPEPRTPENLCRTRLPRRRTGTLPPTFGGLVLDGPLEGRDVAEGAEKQDDFVPLVPDGRDLHEEPHRRPCSAWERKPVSRAAVSRSPPRQMHCGYRKWSDEFDGTVSTFHLAVRTKGRGGENLTLTSARR